MEDSKIIQLYFDRDELAIAETQAKYDGYLRSVSGNVLKNIEDVDECVNDTYLGAWNAIPPTKPTVFRVFLGKIARNLSLKKVRFDTAAKRGGREMDLSIEELYDCIADEKQIDENLALAELTGFIDEFLGERSQEDRNIFVLRYWYFHSVADIADKYGFTESKVKMTLKRTRDDLKVFLENKGVIV